MSGHATNVENERRPDRDDGRTACIGVTLGEESSVGPEVMIPAIAEAGQDGCDVLICVGRALKPWAETLLAQAPDWRRRIRIVAASVGPAGPVEPTGASTAVSRQRALAALDVLLDAAVARTVDAIVTGPVPKGIFDEMSPRPPGQTEYCAGRLGAGRFAMMLAGPRLRVVPVTTHIPLAAVSAALTTDRIVQCALAAAADLRKHFAIAAPRLGICGLNPHAGEGGRIGDEEARVIAPAIAQLRDLGVTAVGPLSADSAFADALAGTWDVVVCMYHDQALGPLKTVHQRTAINFTCGLPVPRMSPDHGTAYSIAGRGVADATSAGLAVRQAVQIATAARGSARTARWRIDTEAHRAAH